LKRYEEAIIEFEKALAIDPNYVDAIIGIGNSLDNLEYFELAIC
jgi:tetratricopeptide (TPR) repeat protein